MLRKGTPGSFRMLLFSQQSLFSKGHNELFVLLNTAVKKNASGKLNLAIQVCKCIYHGEDFIQRWLFLRC